MQLSFQTKIISKNIIFITSSTIICSLVHFLFSVYSRKFVNVTDYGIYTSCLILATYMNYAQLGVLNSYNRDYPQLIGGNHKKDAEHLRNVTLTYILGVFIATAIIAEIIIFIIGRINTGISQYMICGLMITAIMVVFSALEQFSSYSIRMDGYFNFSAVVNIIKTVLSVTVGLIAIREFGYYALYVATPLAAILSLAMQYNKSFRSFRPTWDKSLIKQLIYTGIPLLINALIWTVVTSIDKFIILIFMDTTAMGYYSIALLGFSTMVLIPQSMSQLFYIKMGEEYGRTLSNSNLVSTACRFTKWVSLFTGVSVVVAFYGLPIFVMFFMPNYSDGVMAAQIMLLGVAIYASTMLFGNIFTILKLNKLLLNNTLWLCVFNTVLSSVFVLALGKKIEYIAMGTSLSYVLYSILLILRLRYNLKEPIKQIVISSWAPVSIAIISCLAFYWANCSIIMQFICSILVMTILILILFHKEIKTTLKHPK
ncbi:MAG: oligosaccharide flippase family protein [Anaerovoracaceae bacterium]|jgi:O-antigen/teichoic acid export membrane protein